MLLKVKIELLVEAANTEEVYNVADWVAEVASTIRAVDGARVVQGLEGASILDALWLADARDEEALYEAEVKGDAE